MSKYCLVSIVDSFSTTSIPINEFVIYRNSIRNDYRQVVFIRILDDNKGNVIMPQEIILRAIPNSILEFRNQIISLIRECKQNDEKLIIHLHHQKSALLFFFSSIFLGLRKRTVFTVHSFFSDRDFLYKISSCICSLWSNYSNCVSEAAYMDYPKWIRIIKGKRMRAILNGIDCRRIENALANTKRPDDVFDMKRMICVDRIIPIKNQKFIVGLLKKLPDIRLTLVGMEDKGQEIRKMAINEGVIDRVEFTGLLPRDEVYKKIYQNGLYVTASIVEGLHLSVLEAMRVGAIPIISDIPPHREIAAKSEKLFKPLPLEEDLWISTIKAYQNTEKPLLQDLSEKLSQTTEKHFSLDKMHEEYDAIYNLIIK